MKTDKQILKKWDELVEDVFGLFFYHDHESLEMAKKRLSPFLLDSLEQVRKEERERLIEANGVIRSAYQIAARHGKETNWSMWIKTLERILDKQHKVIFSKVASRSQPEEKKIEKTFWKVLSKSKGMTNIYEIKFVMQSSPTQPEEKKCECHCHYTKGMAVQGNFTSCIHCSQEGESK